MAAPYPHDMMDRGGDGDGAGAGPDRRAAPRHALPFSGRWTARGRWVHVLVETISTHGATLSTLVPLAAAVRGTLSLDDLAMPIPGEVRWARAGVAGVAFDLDEAGRARLADHIARHAGRGQIAPGAMSDPARTP